MLMNATFIGLSFYGWAKWVNQFGSRQQLHISHASTWQLLLTTVFIAVGTFIFLKFFGKDLPPSFLLPKYIQLAVLKLLVII